MLALALVAVIGLIAYLVVKGDPIPAPVERAVAVDLPAPAAAPSDSRTTR